MERPRPAGQWRARSRSKTLFFNLSSSAACPPRAGCTCVFSRSFTYGALSSSHNTILISSVALSRDVSYEGKPECTTRALAPSKYSKSDTLRTKIVAAVGSVGTSFGLFFLCGLRPTLTPSTLPVAQVPTVHERRIISYNLEERKNDHGGEKRRSR